jgi:hypothetical protein
MATSASVVCPVCARENEPSSTACASCGSDITGPRRSTLLTFILTVCALANTVALTGIVGRLATVPAARVGHALADTVLTAAFVGLSLLGIAGIGHWRRWGAYVFLASSLLSIALATLMGAFTIRFAVSVAIVAAVSFCLRKQWQHFH